MTTLPFEPADITVRSTVAEIVEIYQTQIAHVREAYDILQEAGEKLTQAFGKETSYLEISALPQRCYHADTTLKEVEHDIRARCWRNLIARLGIRKVLSLKRNEELSKRLDEGDKLPDITVPEVFALFETLTANAGDFIKEAIHEVYDLLHVTPGWGTRGNYKTNQRNAFEDIGKKVILCGWVRVAYGREHFEANYYFQEKLRAVDKVFHALDSKQFAEAGYASPLIDAINTAPGGRGHTDYFRFQCYANGNLHLEFTRPDLLKLFNRYANNGTALKSGRIF